MSLITEGLYLGDYRDATSKKWLKQHNISHIVNCAKEHKEYFPGDFVYLSLNLDDSEEQVIYHVLEQSFQFIKDALDKGGSVLVHCHAGISRSSSVLIYYLMKATNNEYDRMYFYVKSRRPQVDPNPGFIKQLISTTPAVRRR